MKHSKKLLLVRKKKYYCLEFKLRDLKLPSLLENETCKLSQKEKLQCSGNSVLTGKTSEIFEEGD